MAAVVAEPPGSKAALSEPAFDQPEDGLIWVDAGTARRLHQPPNLIDHRLMIGIGRRTDRLVKRG
jgi:hypothetical protein